MPETDRSAEITSLLRAANAGDNAAEEELIHLLYDELRWLAQRNLRRGGRGDRLATTELVHEAYLKLARPGQLPDRNRHHFLGAASRAMRQVLITEARRRQAGKRSPDGPRVPLENVSSEDPVESILSINSALEALGSIDERLVAVVECRFFGGLSIEETAATLNTSASTVRRDWRKAKAWLTDRLGRTELLV